MFASPWISALAAIFSWWFFTGIILLVVRRADAAPVKRHGLLALLSLPLFILGIIGLVVSANAATLLNVYLAFMSVLVIWGWIEFVFLLGVITGPEKTPCPVGLGGWPRFVRAWHTLSHHELTLLFGLLIVTVATTGAENTVGFWIYAILFGARISAKLNLFFGVPRINTEFVPIKLEHLKSYFRQGPITLAFPLGVTALMVATGYFGFLLHSADTAIAVVGAALLTALAGLATLEHWLMVVPLPDAKLWRWMLPPLPNSSKTGQSHEL